MPQWKTIVSINEFDALLKNPLQEKPKEKNHFDSKHNIIIKTEIPWRTGSIFGPFCCTHMNPLILSLLRRILGFFTKEELYPIGTLNEA